MNRRREPGPYMSVGWIGVGKMGGPLVRALLEAGIAVTLLEPNLENRASAIAAGGQLAHTVAQLLAGSDIVFTTLGDDATMQELMFSGDAMAGQLRPDQLFVDMSTISPRLSEDIATVLANRGVPTCARPSRAARSRLASEA